MSIFSGGGRDVKDEDEDEDEWEVTGGGGTLWPRVDQNANKPLWSRLLPGVVRATS